MILIIIIIIMHRLQICTKKLNFLDLLEYSCKKFDLNVESGIY